MQELVTPDEQLVQIYVNLPNHPTAQCETLWAQPLGRDLYVLRSCPFFAYGLNRFDTVRARWDDSQRLPEIYGVAAPAGHSTIRVRFSRECPQTTQREVLAPLLETGITVERVTGELVCIDLQPGADREAIREHLRALQVGGVLQYETGEPEEHGSFDAAPVTDSGVTREEPRAVPAHHTRLLLRRF